MGADHAAISSATSTAGTARRRLRLLFLAPFAPDHLGSHGGARATAAIIDMLGRSHDLWVLYLEPAGSEAPRQPPRNIKEFVAVPASPLRTGPKPLLGRAIQSLGMLLWDNPDWVRDTWSPHMARAAAELAGAIRPDIVHFEFHVMSQYLPVVRSASPGSLCVVTEHEPGTSGNNERGSWRQRLSSVARRGAWARFERRALAQADAIVTFTAKDEVEVRRLLAKARTRITCIPLRYTIEPKHSAGEAEPIASDLLFIGGFKHPPNVDAALRLAGRIFPEVRRQLPSARLTIVGADPPPELAAAAGDGINVTGWVDDPAPYLVGASVVLAPLRLGGGMRVKVLEACSFGKAMVASSVAVEGLDLHDGAEFVRAETDEEFADAAVALLRNPVRREQLRQAAKFWADRTQDVDAWAAEYDSLYRQLLASRSPPTGS